MPPPARVELHALLGILRLAHKYDVRYLYLRALTHLDPQCPLSLHDYKLLHVDSITFPLGFPMSDLAVVSAAVEVGALWLLPTAYYSASTHSPNALHTARFQGAVENVVQTCFAGQRHLVRGTAEMQSFLSEAPTPDCTDTLGCQKNRLRELQQYFESLGGPEVDLAPLEEWEEGTSSWDDLKLCSHCMGRAKQLCISTRERFWERLPAIFDLPPWEELRAMRDEVMGETS